MALNTRITTAAANAALDALLALIGASGFLDIYDGTQPAGPATAPTTQTKLARLALSADAFGDASAGVATANAITDGTGLADGTPSWFRLCTAAGAGVLDGSAGTSGTNLVLAAATIATGVTVSVSSLTVTLPTQGA